MGMDHPFYRSRHFGYRPTSFLQNPWTRWINPGSGRYMNGAFAHYHVDAVFLGRTRRHTGLPRPYQWRDTSRCAGCPPRRTHGPPGCRRKRSVISSAPSTGGETSWT